MAFDINRFKESLKTSLSTNRIEQKETFRRAKDFYQCDSWAHIDHIMQEQFAEWKKAKKSVIFRELGVTKGIVDTISLIYREEPERTYNLNGEEIENDDLKEHINSIYDHIGNSFFQMYERMVNAMSTCALMVKYNEELKTIELRILTPDRYDVIVDTDDTTKANAYFYQIDTQDDMTHKQDVTTFFYIDKDEIRQVDTRFIVSKEKGVVFTGTASIEAFAFDDADTARNELGFVPIITTTSETQILDYFVDTNARLLTTGESAMITKDISSNETSFHQGFAVLVHTANKVGAMQMGMADKVKISPKVLNQIKNGRDNQPPEKLEYISPNTDLDQLNKDLTDTFLQIASVFGLNESEGNVKATTSGISLVVSDDKKNKLINANRNTYIRFEKKLFEMIKKINNLHPSAFPNIPEDLSLSVNFKEIETTISPADKIDNAQFLIDNKMRARYRLLMDEDPELTEEDAKKLIDEAEEEDRENQVKMQEMMSSANQEPGDLDGDDDIDDNIDDNTNNQ